MSGEEQFIAHEYKTVTAVRGLDNIYLDSFQNFGWEPDGMHRSFHQEVPLQLY
jgi:hypothetical protein